MTALQIHLKQFRQFINMLFFKFRNFLLNIIQLTPHFFQFNFKKRSGFHGLSFANLQIFLQKKRGKDICDFLCHNGISRVFIGQDKSDVGGCRSPGSSVDNLSADIFKVDIFTHLFNNFFRCRLFTQILVQIQPVDNFQQTGCAHDSLINCLQTLFSVCGHCGHDKISGNFLFFN